MLLFLFYFFGETGKIEVTRGRIPVGNQTSVHFPEMTMDESKELFGNQDKNIKILMKVYETEIILRGDQLIIESNDDQLIHQI